MFIQAVTTYGETVRVAVAPGGYKSASERLSRRIRDLEAIWSAKTDADKIAYALLRGPQ